MENQLSLLYIDYKFLRLDIKLVLIIILAIVSRPVALKWIVRELQHRHAPMELIEVAVGEKELMPSSPPRIDRILMSQE